MVFERSEQLKNRKAKASKNCQYYEKNARRGIIRIVESETELEKTSYDHSGRVLLWEEINESRKSMSLWR